MNNNLLTVLGSRKATIVILVLYIAVMALATIIEKFYGTPIAKAVFYYSPLFLFMQFLMIVNFCIMTFRGGYLSSRKYSYMVIHLSFIVILCGAAVTHFFGEEGLMHIREGESSSQVVMNRGERREVIHLPFSIELLDFRLTRYHGSQSPSSYESYLRLHMPDRQFDQKVYMNNVLDLDGYRFYQASYDRDEMGTILSVNHDVAGRTITYAGYIILFAGLAFMLLDTHSRFRRLWRQLSDKSLLLMVSCFFLSVGSASAQQQHNYISSHHADMFGYMPVQTASGRIVPANTFASEIVRKFKAAKLIGSLTPEQFLLSVMAYPSDWSVIPLVEVNDADAAALLGLPEGRISYHDAFAHDGSYKLSHHIEKIYHKNPAERNRLDKELLKIDDRINIMHGLLTHQLLRLFPNPKDTVHYQWLSAAQVSVADTLSAVRRLSHSYFSSVARAGETGDWHQADLHLAQIRQYQYEHVSGITIDDSRLRAEVYYNKLNLPRLCRMGYLILGAFLLVSSFVRTGSAGRARAVSIVHKSLLGGIFFFLILHVITMGMRWYISGYAPWSNSYETMVSLSCAGVMAGFIFVRKNTLVVALATLFGGVVLFVSGLSWMDPQITPLVPVLKSPWLMAHVASLVMAYGFLGICCMIGTAYLYASISRGKGISSLLHQLAVISELSMILGMSLMTVGIFLGAVWANESWGRYWSWDPKETWALISMIVYAVVLHLRWFGRSEWLFSLLSQLSFLSILMTFLGVNYFLSGMHSYGSHDALSSIPLWAYILFVLFFVLPGLLSALLGGRRK